MIETVEQFKQKQIEIVEILERLLTFIQKGKEFGFKDNDDLASKLMNGIDKVKSERLKVALVGGFSEGKTSIVAAWSGNYDSDTMKIDVSESSDEVQIYKMDDFDLIDTPGLYGYKETINQVKYKEITRKYISEANLILYVMNSNNPVKDSHKEELEWLMKELNLLSRTIFVISRFDEEADIEDLEDYNKHLEIKKENITNRLKDFEIISDNQPISIVAVAANPYGEGFDYWLSDENKNEYNEISHIIDLQKATSKKIEESGGKDSLVYVTSQSIVKDVIQRQLPIIEEKMVSASNELKILKNSLDEVKKEQEKSEKKISSTKIELKEYITELFTDLILQVKGTDIQTVDDFMERNIGNEGIVLDIKIDNEFERQLGKINQEISKFETNLNASVNHYNSMIEDLTIQGVKVGGDLLKNAKVSSDMVFSTRNLLMPSLKFKPWGAIKLAENLSKGLAVFGAVLGVGVEIFDSYSKVQKEKKLKNAVDTMVNIFEEQRKYYIDLINDIQENSEKYFPYFVELQKKVIETEKEVEKKEQFHKEFELWLNEVKMIESDFISFYE